MGLIEKGTLDQRFGEGGNHADACREWSSQRDQPAQSPEAELAWPVRGAAGTPLQLMLVEAGEDRGGEWGLRREADVSHYQDFGLFLGKGKSQGRVLNTGGAGSDSGATLSFKWIILATAVRLGSG